MICRGNLTGITPSTRCHLNAFFYPETTHPVDKFLLQNVPKKLSRNFPLASNCFSRLQDAITALNSLQTNSNILEQLRKSGGRMNATSLPEMREWLRRINYTTDDLNSLNMIHVTGTKGKGSTCAFVTSILQQLYPHWRIGMFTSPHLKAVNERIQVNSVPISEDDFARYFWEVWDRLEAHQSTEEGEVQYKTRKPAYFRFLTLMAWHAFLDMKVRCLSGVLRAYDRLTRRLWRLGLVGNMILRML